ncbi:hypothetical protein [Caballeronia hypogeia]|uniref:hypothetical protein n=1 Tax=Caballeronia hypogeia TaxID=1777140 RepID=UPI0012FDA99E|nr:hypothetical protein [Caballeronia hypogeia]
MTTFWLAGTHPSDAEPAQGPDVCADAKPDAAAAITSTLSRIAVLSLCLLVIRNTFLLVVCATHPPE